MDRPPLTRIAGHEVLFLMAAPAEYGAHLRGRFTPLFTGIGPIEAAVQTTRALATLAAQGATPDLVVSLGSAGSATLEHGAVYQASSVSWRDIDASPLGFPKGITPLLDLPAELPLPYPVPGLHPARLSTGSTIVSGAAYDAIDADMVDMETFATLRACQAYSVPLIALRGISDGQSELTGLHDWADYLPLVDQALGQAVDLLSTALARGLLR